MISAQIIADSVSVHTGRRITTFELVIPKWLVAEINTHRQCARSSASSRAVPTVTLLEKVLTDPFIPHEWRYRNPAGGMQAGELMSDQDALDSEADWLGARDAVLPFIKNLEKRKAAKEHLNRLLEPWLWTVVVMTATEWENYFWLRCSHHAQPEFRQVAILQRDLLAASSPVQRRVDKNNRTSDAWHLPYVTPQERLTWSGKVLVMLSVVRCARVSYYRQGEVRSLQQDQDRYNDLVVSGHFSALEHTAKVIKTDRRYGPFVGWKQARKYHRGEAGPIKRRGIVIP